MAHWIFSRVWLLFIVVWLSGWGLTTIQVRHYRHFLQTVRAKSRPGQIFASGIGKSWLRSGCVVGVITDPQGQITEAYRMSGRSVFARFRPWPEVVGKNIAEWAHGHSKRSTPVQRAMAQAADLTFRQWAGTSGAHDCVMQ